MRASFRLGRVAATLLAIAVTTAAQAAPVTFNTALPVADQEFVARAELVIGQSGDDRSGADRDRRSTALVAALGYGVTGRLALFGVLPYVDNELTLTTGGERATRTASGFGDLALFGRYTVYQQDRPGRTLRVAPFAGLKAPTGEDDASNTRGRLPPDVQVGLGRAGGSGDDLPDRAVSTRRAARVSGQQRSERFRGRRYRATRRLMSIPLATARARAGCPGIRLRRRAQPDPPGKHRVGGAADPNSGGTRLFLTPGVQYVTKRWIAEAAVQWPVSQALNGTALESDYVVRAGFWRNF